MASGDGDSVLGAIASDMGAATADTHVSYQEACSFQTVQSNPKGFFRQFYSRMLEAFMQNGKLEEFGKLATNEQRISQLFADGVGSPLMQFMLKVKPVYEAKCEKKSATFRSMANKMLLLSYSDQQKRVDHLEQALSMANISVLRAPAKENCGDALATSLLLRATILLGLDRGEAALNDVKFAADVCPAIKKISDYYEILAKCYQSVKDVGRAEVSLKLAERMGNQCDAEVELSSQNLRNYNQLIQKTENLTISVASAATGAVPKHPKRTNGKHDKWKAASGLLTLSQTPDNGRFMVARKRINAGNVVLCEDPLAACLNHECIGSYCYHCFVKMLVAIPCLDCSGVAFCSMECMRSACETYHRYECQFMNLLIGSGMSILCFLALKVFAQSPSVEEAFKVSESVYNDMCSHVEERSVDDHLHRSLMAVFLMRCLQKSGYFGPDNTENRMPTDVERKACAHLLGLLQVLQYNAHEIYSRECKGSHVFDNSNVVYIGVGLYKTGALFNHECWPTLARHFDGARLVLTAIKPHAPGEVLAENYGPIVSKMDANKRQETLKGRYLFDCHCSACLGKWPVWERISNSIILRCRTPNCCKTFPLAKLDNLRPTCTACHKKLDFRTSIIALNRVEELYTEASQCIVKENVSLAIKLFNAGLNEFFKVALLPHRTTMVAQLSLIKCLGIASAKNINK